MPASKHEVVQLAPTPESKGKGILFPAERSQWSSTQQHCFCSTVTVLPFSIWGENRMTNRAWSCDVSKIVNVRAVKPILGEEAEDCSGILAWRSRLVRAASLIAGMGSAEKGHKRTREEDSIFLGGKVYPLKSSWQLKRALCFCTSMPHYPLMRQWKRSQRSTCL